MFKIFSINKKKIVPILSNLEKLENYKKIGLTYKLNEIIVTELIKDENYNHIYNLNKEIKIDSGLIFQSLYNLLKDNQTIIIKLVNNNHFTIILKIIDTFDKTKPKEIKKYITGLSKILSHFENKKTEDLEKILNMIYEKIQKYTGYFIYIILESLNRNKSITEIFENFKIIKGLIRNENRQGLCEDVEKFNKKILKEEEFNNKRIIIFLNNDLIGQIRLKNERNFLSYINAIDKTGKIILIKGASYAIEKELIDFLNLVHFKFETKNPYRLDLTEFSLNFLRIMKPELYSDFYEDIENNYKNILNGNIKTEKLDNNSYII